MVKRVQRFGHSQAQADDFIGLEREITIDTTNWEVRVHDAVTPGGHRLINKETADALYAPAGSNSFDTLLVNVINELTLGAGVTVETVSIKDGLVDGVDVGVLATTFVDHVTNIANPHGTNKSQIGLPNVIDGLQLLAAQNLNDLPDKAAARANLGVTIGTNVQAADPTLTALATLDGTTGLLTEIAADSFARRTLVGTASQIAIADGDAVAGNPTFTLPDPVIFPGTGGVQVPTGNTAQRAGGDGSVRYNSQTFAFEFKHNGAWTPLDFTAITNAVQQIATGTMGAATTLTLSIVSLYKHIQIKLNDVAVATDLRDFLMRFAVDGAGTPDTAANYQYRGDSSSAGGLLGLGSEAATSVQINGSDQLGNVANETACYIIDIHRPSDTANFVEFQWRGFARTNIGSRGEIVWGGGAYLVADNITDVIFLLSGSGNFTCKYDIYGMP